MPSQDSCFDLLAFYPAAPYQPFGGCHEELPSDDNSSCALLPLGVRFNDLVCYPGSQVQASKHAERAREGLTPRKCSTTTYRGPCELEDMRTIYPCGVSLTRAFEGFGDMLGRKKFSAGSHKPQRVVQPEKMQSRIASCKE